jgi:hypothetical protein
MKGGAAGTLGGAFLGGRKKKAPHRLEDSPPLPEDWEREEENLLSRRCNFL